MAKATVERVDEVVVSTAYGMDTTNQKIKHFIITDIFIYSVLSLCPWPSAGPQIKKLNTDNTEEHGSVFHG